ASGHGYGRRRIGLDGGAWVRGDHLVAGVRDHRYRTGRGRSRLFCVRELHDVRIWRRGSYGALAADWTDNRHEWRAPIRLVHRRHLRGAAKDNNKRLTHGGCRENPVI